MTTSKLRTIIREEIQTEIKLLEKRLLKELRELRSVNKPVINEDRIDPEQYFKPKIQAERQKVLKSSKASPQYTKNKILNKILQETSGFDEPLEIYPGDYSSRNEFDFLLDDEPSKTPIPKYDYNKPTPQVQKRIMQEKIEGPQGEAIDTSKPEVQTVLNVMNMNFSDKLKAMDKAAKSIRPQ